MSSSGSTRDLAKAISVFIPSAGLPLPQDLTAVIEGYLQRHAEYDQATEERLHEELLSIYNKSVHDYPTRYAPFLCILRLLRPTIRSPTHLVQWWDKLVEPVLDHVDDEKGLASEALAAVESILIDDDDDDDLNGHVPNPIAGRVLEKWMEVFQVAQPEGVSSISFREKLLRQTVLLFGKRKPRSFFNALNGFFVKKEFRSRAICLLSDFIQSQPPHIYAVLQTPLFHNTLQCLQNDTSTTVISLALTSLIMLLPHMPSSLVPFLPTLFNIYARLLFWDRERAAAVEGLVPSETERRGSGSDASWEECSFSPETDGISIPYLLGYFTILYGLYPLNFMDYIRKPQRYLRHANAPNADEIEVQPSEIRHRSERFRQWHLLHPNFYSLTIDSEKLDFARWIKSEPADVVAECVALCLPMDGSHVHPSNAPATAPAPIGADAATSSAANEDADKGELQQALLSESGAAAAGLPPQDVRSSKSTGFGSPSSSRAQSMLARRGSQSSHRSARDSLETRAREAGGDSPTLPPHLVVSTSHTDLQDMINSNKFIKSSLHQSLANDSVPSLALSHSDSVPEKSPAKSSPHPPAASASPTNTESGEQTAELRRQILLLKNDLNFERYMKQQHMAHIGALRRGQVKEAAAEAETQNLIMANRNLKHRLDEAKRAEMQVKKESEKSRMLAKKWESELASKLRTLREEQKRWSSREATLERDLQTAKEECDKLRKLLCEAEVQDLNTKQTMRSFELQVGETERLQGEVSKLAASARESQERERERDLARQEAAELENRLAILNMRLTAREAELMRTKEYYESQVVVLNAKLAEALRSLASGSGGSIYRKDSNGDASSTIESMLAASRAKHLELQKQHSLLVRKYTVLQSSLLDMTCTVGAARPRIETVVSPSEADTEAQMIVGSPHSGHTGSSGAGVGAGAARTRRHRGASDADSAEAASPYSPTPPLELLASGTSTGSSAANRPSTPSQARPDFPGGTGSTSPQSERYYGRGGVQNALRKGGKDKKKEESDKKDKKTTGIRGIRGFV